MSDAEGAAPVVELLHGRSADLGRAAHLALGEVFRVHRLEVGQDLTLLVAGGTVQGLSSCHQSSLQASCNHKTK